MHTALKFEPSQDLGFVVDNDGNLIPTIARQAQPQAGCGFIRDANGDLTPDGTDPTIGFFHTVGGDLEPRVI